MTKQEIIQKIQKGTHCLKVNPNKSSHEKFVNVCFPNRTSTGLVKYYKYSENLNGYDCSNFSFESLIIDLEIELNPIKYKTNLNINLSLI